MDPLDPDFIPHGSIFSLKWSPWLVSDSSRTATLAYTASNHVGFRKITLTDDWQNGQRPKLTVERYDTTTVCVSLSADAFIEWEDVVSPYIYQLFAILLNFRFSYGVFHRYGLKRVPRWLGES